MNKIDRLVVDAMNGYLRTCSNGGMPSEIESTIRDHVEAAGDLSYFSVALARAYKPDAAEAADRDLRAWLDTLIQKGDA